MNELHFDMMISIGQIDTACKVVCAADIDINGRLDVRVRRITAANERLKLPSSVLPQILAKAVARLAENTPFIAFEEAVAEAINQGAEQ